MTPGAKPSAGLELDLYYGDVEDAAVRSAVLLAPGFHTVVAMTKQKHRATDRRMHIVQFHGVKKPCVETYEYKYIRYSKSSFRFEHAISSRSFFRRILSLPV